MVHRGVTALPFNLFFDPLVPWLAFSRLSDRGVTCREKLIGRENGSVGLGTGGLSI